MSDFVDLREWEAYSGTTHHLAATSHPEGPNAADLGLSWIPTSSAVRIFSPDRPAPDGAVPLTRWCSKSRHDYFTTSHPDFRDRFDEVRQPDYRFVRHEGFVFEQPRLGTRALNGFYSKVINLNWLVIGPEWPATTGTAGEYDFARVEGYAPHASADAPELLGHARIPVRGHRPMLAVIVDFEDQEVERDQVYYDQLLFGRRRHSTEGTVPLYRWFSPPRNDHLVTTDPQGVSTPEARPAHPRRVLDYRFVRLEGHLADPVGPQPPGTVALHAWYNPTTDVERRFTTTLSAWSEPAAPPAAPWRYVAMLGYVRTSDAAGSPAAALHTWRAADSRTITTCHPAWRGGPGETRDGGYSWERIEGYLAIEPGPGLVPLSGWYSPGRDDHLLGTGESWSVDQRAETYRLDRIDARIFDPARPQPTGTVALNTFWDIARVDHLTTSDPALDPTHPPTGMRFVRHEGYVCDPGLAQPAGTLPLERWSTPGGEHSVTLTSRSTTAGQDRPWLDRVRLEGYVVPPEEPHLTSLIAHYGAMSRALFAPDRAGLVRVRLPVRASQVREMTGRLDVDFLAAAALQGGFDFRRFSAGGRVDPEDLLVVVVVPAYDHQVGQGQKRNPPPAAHVQDLTVNPGLVVTTEGNDLNLFSHETCHHFIEAIDIYGPGQAINNDASVMADQNPKRFDTGMIQLDPWHRNRVGWTRPEVYRMTDPGHSILVNWNTVFLYDPRRGTQEYFAIELRGPGANGPPPLDAALTDTGMFVWHVTEDGSGNLLTFRWPRDGEGAVSFTTPPIVRPSTGVADAKSLYTIGPKGAQFGDATVWPAPSPPYRLRWSDGTPTDTAISFDTFPSTTGIWVAWRRSDVRESPLLVRINPWLAGTEAGTLKVVGSFPFAGVELRVTRVETGSLRPAETILAEPWRASARLGADPPGVYEVRAVTSDGAVSNALTFERS